ncbi:hypothetical protein N7532_002173 [Penicillium argentinense]|uniref:NAD-dependent epimerase/dehydratase domain-containing protein n=1 Tax=Penicillium argentinense TaxID=1131581 RepID=A0A9W9G410_9EURO|nr:uncharacterized protein N7532_002173 [Penicillium argentinense]KAJ5111638.1 hypothetical protein N7532_002173 [Penicillium argentinense]
MFPLLQSQLATPLTSIRSSCIMAGELIFITGATGFVGSATALAALKAGYRLRVCVRKVSDRLQALLSEHSEQVEYVTIPDLTDETAFQGKLNGVDYVLHLASAVPRGTDKKDYFIPAVKGTTVLLKEAAGVASIKKVVVTSSRAALIPLSGVPAGGIVKEDNDWDLSVDENASFEVPTDPAATAFRLYHASKLLSNNAAWSFWQNEKPHYSLVSLHPAFVLGHNLVQSSPDEIGSNSVLWKPIMTGTFGRSVAGVHIQDVAEAHIKALNPDIPDGSKYLLAGKPITWKDVAQIVHRDYPNVGTKISMEVEGEQCPTTTPKQSKNLG